jgi:hypothetical protein
MKRLKPFFKSYLIKACRVNNETFLLIRVNEWSIIHIPSLKFKTLAFAIIYIFPAF